MGAEGGGGIGEGGRGSRWLSHVSASCSMGWDKQTEDEVEEGVIRSSVSRRGIWCGSTAAGWGDKRSVA